MLTRNSLLAHIARRRWCLCRSTEPSGETDSHIQGRTASVVRTTFRTHRSAELSGIEYL